MSSDNLAEYRGKLQKSKQQLKKVKQLLTQQPHNENLLSLKKDLEEVITVTENLILKKQEKSFDPDKINKNKNKNKNNNNKHNRNNNNKEQRQYDNNYDNKESLSSNHSSSSNPNIYANNPMFIQNKALSKTDKEKKPIPREWGIKKEEYEIGERCQVKWQRKWYIAKILNRVNDNKVNRNDDDDEEKQKDDDDDDILYRVCFLNDGQEYTASINHIRSYVAPLSSQLNIGDKIKAIWCKDGRFYPAIIQEIGDNDFYKIKFEKYNEFGTVPLYDIQLINKNINISNNNNLICIDNKSGNLLIADNANIPQSLWSRDDDTPAEREKKRKKIRSIKRQHRNLKLDIESKNRANNWLRFKSKSLKKSKKKFKSTLLRKDKIKSIFESPSNTTNSIIDSNANMTHFKQRTHFHHLKKDPKHYKNNNNKNNNNNNNNNQ